MGLLDKLRGRGKEEDEPLDLPSAPPVVLDETARTRQLLVLASDLDDLVAAMKADESRRYSPGWAGRLAEYEAAGARARELRRDGFDHEALLDLASEVRPLFVRRPGSLEPDPAFLALEPQQDAVMRDVRDLRTVLPSERGS